MEKKNDKDTIEHKAFYEEFIKFTYTTFIIIVIVALMAIFLV